jgi:hypothetical protein
MKRYFSVMKNLKPIIKPGRYSFLIYNIYLMHKDLFIALLLLGSFWSVSPLPSDVAGLYLGTPSLIQTA